MKCMKITWGAVAALCIVGAASADVFECIWTNGWKAIGSTESLTVGDKVFSNFVLENDLVVNGIAPDSFLVQEARYQVGDQELYGLRFLSSWSVGVYAGSPVAGSVASRISYDVEVQSGSGYHMVGHQLSVPPPGWLQLGAASAQITKNVYNAGGLVSSLNVVDGNNPFDEAGFPSPQTFLTAANTIALSSENWANCGVNGAMVMMFDNVYIQEVIPEPGTAGMLATGSIVLIALRRRMEGFRPRNRRGMGRGRTS